jgi:hypothetical protein
MPTQCYLHLLSSYQLIINLDSRIEDYLFRKGVAVWYVEWEGSLKGGGGWEEMKTYNRVAWQLAHFAVWPARLAPWDSDSLTSYALDLSRTHELWNAKR